MTMSIVHRATGIANYAGTALLVLWLFAAAVGGGFFDGVNWLFGSWIGQIVLFGYTWSLVHHMLGGVRHFVWDLTKGMDAMSREMLVRLQLGTSVAVTIIGWILFVVLK